MIPFLQVCVKTKQKICKCYIHQQNKTLKPIQLVGSGDSWVMLLQSVLSF